MWHNKFISWDRFFEVVEHVERMSPWLSRQILKHVSDWPFWISGARIEQWQDGRVWVQLPRNLRNSLEGELCQGHLLLAGELTMRLALLHFRRELPFHYRIFKSQVELHHATDQAVDIRFELTGVERERLRLELMRESTANLEYVLSAYLGDGRLAATLTFHAAFELEKFLPA